MQDAFSNFHPIVNFTYFTLVLIITMFIMHPIFLLISALCAFLYSLYLKGTKALLFSLKYLLPLLIITALLNPAFNHEGATILLYFPNGNPLTLESILYGIAAATMLISIIMWFSCFNIIISSDKIVYIFGRIIPALSLIVAMVLRFVPRFREQIKEVSAAQKCLGRDISAGNIWQRIGTGLTILSIMITWAMENSVETADSMQSRGYGLKGRTAFSIYKFVKADKISLAIIILLGIYILVGIGPGGIKYAYFPVATGISFNIYSISIFGAYLLLCLMPLLINMWQAKKWKKSQQFIQLKI